MNLKKQTSIITALLLLIIIFPIWIFAQKESDALISTEGSVEESVKLVPCKNENRGEAVKKLFFEMGAKEADVTVEKFNKNKISNIVVKKKGKTDETIVVGAHYDKTDDGCGAIDNWTGISIIAHLFKTLRQIETKKSYVFVAFDQEEKGLFGSDEMAKAIPKEARRQYCAMINFDSFGFTAPMSLQNASSSKMIAVAKKLAKENQLKIADVAIEGADADSSSFKNRDIPAITFNGLDGNWRNYLHTRNDKISSINMSSVYFGYRFGLMYAAKIDSMMCSELR